MVIPELAGTQAGLIRERALVVGVRVPLDSPFPYAQPQSHPEASFVVVVRYICVSRKRAASLVVYL